MHQPTTFALLSAIYSFTVAAAGSLPRGVGPDFASYYQDAKEFRCITNTAIKLSLSQINDNTCDCPDASDEPGTAACASIDSLSPKQPLPGSPSGTTDTDPALPGFWCANKGHIGSYVPFSYVNDGVCDYDLCCDGTEEYSHKAKCPNKCAEIGKEYRRLEAEKKGKLERAGKQRLAMVDLANIKRQEIKLKITSLKAEVVSLQVKVDELTRKHEEAERNRKHDALNGSGSGGKLGALVELVKTRVENLRNTLASVIQQRDLLQEKVDELETILRKFKEEYNPNFNDEGVKAAVKSFEDYAASEEKAESAPTDVELEEMLKVDSEASGVNWKDFEGIDAKDTDHVDDTPRFLGSLISNALDHIRRWLVDKGVLAGSHAPTPESESAEVKAAEKDLKKKQKDLASQEEDLTKDYGPQDIFRSLQDKCVSTDSGEYTYELCWMGKTSQKSKKGHSNTSMGTFARIDREYADDEDRLDGRSLGTGERMVLRYEDGQSCWNGPRRRTDVWLGCAETEQLWRVTEAEKCVYKMEVGTPAACEPEAIPKAEKPVGKDEL